MSTDPERTAESARKIALFNHKGGVSKTTTVFNLGWMLAERGSTVVIVDGDPQCNLTGMVLGYKGAEELEAFYENHGSNTLKAGLAPAFEAQPRAVEAVELVAVEQRPGLFLLAGDLRLAEYEVTLGIAQQLSAAIQALQNLPGSINYLIDQTAQSVGADYVLLDMSPGLGPLNQNLVSISDFVIVPTAPDFFSVMAIDSLSRVLPRWKEWAMDASAMEILSEAAYPFPEPRMKVLGTIVQRFRPRGDQPASRFQRWIDELAAAVVERLTPALERADMLLPGAIYERFDIGRDLNLATIRDFNSLISMSQEHATPVFSLSRTQLEAVGVVLEGFEQQRDELHVQFDTLASLAENLIDAFAANARG